MDIDQRDSGNIGLGCLALPMIGLMTVYALYGVFDGYLIIPNRRGEAATFEGVEARLGGIGLFVLFFAFLYFSYDGSKAWRGFKNIPIGSFVFGLALYLLIKIFIAEARRP